MLGRVVDLDYAFLMAAINYLSHHSSGNISGVSVKDSCSVIRVGSLNCQGLNEYYKRMALFEYLKSTDLANIPSRD